MLIKGTLCVRRCGIVMFSWRMAFAIYLVHPLRPRYGGQHFAWGIFNCIFFNKNIWNSTKFPMKCIPRGPSLKVWSVMFNISSAGHQTYGAKFTNSMIALFRIEYFYQWFSWFGEYQLRSDCSDWSSVSVGHFNMAWLKRQWQFSVIGLQY